ncbi:MAG: hypothetical protein ABEJ23_05085 [Haloarculaceae archaeon]
MTLDVSALLALFRAHPGRSMVLSVAPVLVASAQSVNALVHGVTSPLVAAFVVALLAFAVGATYHCLASFRLESLEADLRDLP